MIDHTLYDTLSDKPLSPHASGAFGAAGLFPMLGLMGQAWAYYVDAWQRHVLFNDVLRKQGNVYFEHKRKGLPPVLSFGHEIVMDGRELARPVNYALARILPDEGVELDPTSRPIVIVDPRAGHGPGIGGSKKDSEMGLSLRDERPTYFVMFFPDPVPGQTIEDVMNAEIAFVERVKSLHPEAPAPAVIGNCQAGWAVAMMAAKRPDLAGPIVMVGSPLSYWAGEDGDNPMRYRGGLMGGAWPASFLSDLGGGRFDGAYLVGNFEYLNPANTFWKKKYHLYSNVDTEEDRYLNFEKWWNGFADLTEEEIKFIASELFIGNKLERGEVELESGERINLRNIRRPIIIFCSEGDNITHPKQALNWVFKVWRSEEELKADKQVIVYLVHESIGHLGIFVSASIARKHHKEIMTDVDAVDYLAPGLYEMIIEESEASGESGRPAGGVRYEERKFSDVVDLKRCEEDEEAFAVVDKISTINDAAYKRLISPMVRAVSTRAGASALKAMHPLRAPRYYYSDYNPMMYFFKVAAPLVKKHRRPVSPDNPFLEAEKKYSDFIVKLLDMRKEIRDKRSQVIFRKTYDHPLVKRMFLGAGNGNGRQCDGGVEVAPSPVTEAERSRLLAAMGEGGFVEAAIRIMIAVARADGCFSRSEFKAARRVSASYPELGSLDPREVRRIASDQARMLQVDENEAIKSLSALIPDEKSRRDALQVARQMAEAGVKPEGQEKLLARIEEVLLGRPGPSRPSL